MSQAADDVVAARSQDAADDLRQFRVVLTSETSVRLMDRAGDPPSTWRLPFDDDSRVSLVAVRDITIPEQGIPRHAAFQYVVEIKASDLETAVHEAKTWAETAAFMVAAASRAPIGPIWQELGYEIAPEIEEREFRQWIWDPAIPIGKPTANAAAFGELRDRINRLAAQSPPSKLVWRVVLSLSWFRQALEETDALFRFHKLWIAVETLNPLLDEHYEIPEDQRSGFQGLRRLADDVGQGSVSISETLGLRRDVFHGLRVTAEDLRMRATAAVPCVEHLCVAAWRALLDLEEPFPDASVVPFRLHLQVSAVLLHRDASKWDLQVHPFLIPTIELENVNRGDARDVTFKMPIKFSARNADRVRLTSLGMWGPSGYQPLRSEGEPEVQIVRLDEAPEPDPPEGAAPG